MAGVRDYDWKDPRNAAGAAGELARRAMAVYVGPSKDVLEAAIVFAERAGMKDNEVALGFNVGFTHGAAEEAADDAFNVGDTLISNKYASTPSVWAAYAAGRAARAVSNHNYIENVIDSVIGADPTLDTDMILYKWIAKDLGVKLTPAVIGALSIGDTKLAEEINT